jgi:hypothetical protein
MKRSQVRYRFRFGTNVWGLEMASKSTLDFIEYEYSTILSIPDPTLSCILSRFSTISELKMKKRLELFSENEGFSKPPPRGRHESEENISWYDVIHAWRFTS